MIQNHGTRCKSVYLAADVMSCTLEKSKFYDCEMLHWAWEGVYRSVLHRVMSLASTNPHQMLRAETAVSLVALLQSSCGNDTQSWDSMQISAPGCRCDELYFEKIYFLWLWHAVPGMAGGVQVCIEASNEPCIHKSAADVACRDSARPVALLRSRCENDTQSWGSMQVSAPGCRCDELYFEKIRIVIVTCCTGHGRGCKGLHWSEPWALHPQIMTIMTLIMTIMISHRTNSPQQELYGPNWPKKLTVP